MISAFVIRFFESIISKLATSEISIFELVSVAEATGLCLTSSKTKGQVFSRRDPIYALIVGGCGGGILILNARELIKVNGELSANGQDSNARGGGGSGGSISIQTSEFDGTGDIMVIFESAQ